MRILICHGHAGPPPFGTVWIDSWIGRLQQAGHDVDGMYIGVNARDRRLEWQELDRRWRIGDRELMALYEAVADSAAKYDALVNYGGLNLHPAFLEQLNVTTALAFFDDPESSESCSRPVAAAHDICLVGNAAEVGRYASWGARAEWYPLGFRADDYDPSLMRDEILCGPRDVPVSLLCERRTHWRRERVDKFARTFPEGVFRGPGWPLGFLPENERVPLLRRTKIGVNVHNSTGPINFRTYYLPANGVLQICDNRAHLHHVFEPGREIVGFETIEEAIDLCRYYLEHDDERREIAAAGWTRAIRDYNEVTVFERMVRALEQVARTSPSVQPCSLNLMLSRHRSETRLARAVHRITTPLRWPIANAVRVRRGVHRRWLRLRDNLRLRLSRSIGLGASER